MNVSTTKLIAILAAAAGILTTNAAFAGGSHNSSHSSSNTSKLTTSSSNFNTINKGSVNPTQVLGKVGTVSSTTNAGNIINRNGIDPTKVLGKSGTVSSLPNGGNIINRNGIDPTKVLGKSGTTIVKDPVKDPCKNDWKKFCYPYYFGCSYPSYSCYDYCEPSYCFPTYGCNYGSSLTVLSGGETTRMRVAIGSVIMLNGQSFGGQAGGVRLRVSGMAMPIQVVEWTPNGVKAQLPQLELTSITPAEIEVVRPDGSLASKTAVELTAAPEQLALGR